MKLFSRFSLNAQVTLNDSDGSVYVVTSFESCSMKLFSRFSLNAQVTLNDSDGSVYVVTSFEQPFLLNRVF